MITVQDVAKELGFDFSLESGADGRYFKEVAATVDKLSSAERAVLRACNENGPLEDGDIPSKTGRDELLHKGFVTKVVVRGDQGYNACTYKGHLALRILNAKEKLEALAALDESMLQIVETTDMKSFTIKIDPKDPDPIKTIEMAQKELIGTRRLDTVRFYYK